MQTKEKVVILDFGGHKSQSVARRVRQLHVYCEIHPAQKPYASWMDDTVKAVLLIGGDAQAHEKTCGGLNLAYGAITEADFPSLGGAAKSGAPKGDLKAFLDSIDLAHDYAPEDQIDQMLLEIRQTVGEGRVVSGLSGGVDSSVASVLVGKALKPEQLTCIFVDHGLLRLHEAEQVLKTYRDNLNLNVIHVDASARFLEKLKGVTEPERKRKIIGEEFIRVFEEEAKKIGADFLLQGTIYPDIIESGVDGSATIKSHHNVGGIPEDSLFDAAHIVEPLKHLFKDEVRAVGTALGIPHAMVYRQPFPGPGIGVRCIGELKKDRLDKLRECDWIFREEIDKAGLADSIWQYFAILTPLQTVGVKNEKRTYADLLALRAVNTQDAMSAVAVELPYPLLKKVTERIIGEVDGVNRVVYDITDKPPGTIEWE